MSSLVDSCLFPLHLICNSIRDFIMCSNFVANNKQHDFIPNKKFKIKNNIPEQKLFNLTIPETEFIFKKVTHVLKCFEQIVSISYTDTPLFPVAVENAMNKNICIHVHVFINKNIPFIIISFIHHYYSNHHWPIQRMSN